MTKYFVIIIIILINDVLTGPASYSGFKTIAPPFSTGGGNPDLSY